LRFSCDPPSSGLPLFLLNLSEYASSHHPPVNFRKWSFEPLLSPPLLPETFPFPFLSPDNQASLMSCPVIRLMFCNKMFCCDLSLSSSFSKVFPPPLETVFLGRSYVLLLDFRNRMPFRNSTRFPFLPFCVSRSFAAPYALPPPTCGQLQSWCRSSSPADLFPPSLPPQYLQFTFHPPRPSTTCPRRLVRR